jgi:hypothetical protein
MIGGSAVGTELGQFLARMGAHVTLLQRGDRLLDREDPRVGGIVATHLREEGIDVRLGRQATAARRDGDEAVVELDDGTTVRADVVVLGTGRRLRTDRLGLDTARIEPNPRGALDVDEHCRVTDGLWALGDVTGVALFTHVAMYQGRIVADNILGTPAKPPTAASSRRIRRTRKRRRRPDTRPSRPSVTAPTALLLPHISHWCLLHLRSYTVEIAVPRCGPSWRADTILGVRLRSPGGKEVSDGVRRWSQLPVAMPVRVMLPCSPSLSPVDAARAPVVASGRRRGAGPIGDHDGTIISLTAAG